MDLVIGKSLCPRYFPKGSFLFIFFDRRNGKNISILFIVVMKFILNSNDAPNQPSGKFSKDAHDHKEFNFLEDPIFSSFKSDSS